MVKIKFIFNTIGFLLGFVVIGIWFWEHQVDKIWIFISGIGWYLFGRDFFRRNN